MASCCLAHAHLEGKVDLMNFSHFFDTPPKLRELLELEYYRGTYLYNLISKLFFTGNIKLMTCHDN